MKIPFLDDVPLNPEAGGRSPGTGRAPERSGRSGPCLQHAPWLSAGAALGGPPAGPPTGPARRRAERSQEEISRCCLEGLAIAVRVL